MEQKNKICVGCGRAKKIFSKGRCLECCRPSFKSISRIKKEKKTPNKNSDPVSLPGLIKKLDAIFSLYIRYRGSESGYNYCITCGSRLLVKHLQDGHFISRANTALRWDENNNHPQCERCNIILSGNMAVYESKMLELYGLDFLNKLKAKKNQELKLDRLFLKEKIEYYSKQLSVLIDK